MSQRLPPDPHDLRRQNALLAFQAFVEAQVSAGAPPKGLEQAFAEHLQIQPSLWSMVKSGKRDIGDKLARLMERQLGKPEGWMDAVHEAPGLTAQEEAFLNLALKTWRSCDPEERKRLRMLLKAFS